MTSCAFVGDEYRPRSQPAVQLRFLEFPRATAVNKGVGLTREQAAEPPLPSSPRTSALGAVKHLTAVERWWLSLEAGGSDAPSLWPDSPDPRWDPAAGDDPVSMVAACRAEWERSAAALTGPRPEDRTRRGGEFTVRWVPAHVVQETARHVGHLDALREPADGDVGE
ncbi:DUF664 domain-containing protein [Amycolatopsis sp. NPDC051373]|uniref:mycothiol transferase n=1 Tax=Amycolatopsis sp. NPDC051373 TaxID=3155801 RepID=UPI00344FC7BC